MGGSVGFVSLSPAVSVCLRIFSSSVLWWSSGFEFCMWAAARQTLAARDGLGRGSDGLPVRQVCESLTGLLCLSVTLWQVMVVMFTGRLTSRGSSGSSSTRFATSALLKSSWSFSWTNITTRWGLNTDTHLHQHWLSVCVCLCALVCVYVCACIWFSNQILSEIKALDRSVFVYIYSNVNVMIFFWWCVSRATEDQTSDCVKVHQRTVDLLHMWVEDALSVDFSSCLLQTLESFLTSKVIEHELLMSLWWLSVCVDESQCCVLR